MKPAAFNYHRPRSVDEALAMHAAAEDPRFIAGGQSLVPMMSLRLAAPSDLIDLNTVDELTGISHSATHIRVGAMTRQEDLTADEIPLCPGTGDESRRGQRRTSRNQNQRDHRRQPVSCRSLGGTAGLVAGAGRDVLLASSGGETRSVAVEDFFGGYFQTTIGHDEVLTEIRIPVAADRRMGFHEVTLRSADFAEAGAIASAHADADGGLGSIRVVTFALGDRPQRLHQVEAAVVEANGDADAIGSAAQLTEDLISPLDEPHLSATYRRQLGVTVVRRALESALRTERR